MGKKEVCGHRERSTVIWFFKNTGENIGMQQTHREAKSSATGLAGSTTSQAYEVAEQPQLARRDGGVSPIN